MNKQKLGAVFTQLALAGETLREAGHVDQAITCFEALSMGDDSFECGAYAFDLALCYEKKEQWNKSLEYLQIAIRENPTLYANAPDSLRILKRKT